MPEGRELGEQQRLLPLGEEAFGEVTGVQVSSTHLYHATSMIRHMLGADIETPNDEGLTPRAVARPWGRAVLPHLFASFARPGEECLHNLRYWTRGEYHGFGLGAPGSEASGWFDKLMTWMESQKLVASKRVLLPAFVHRGRR